MSRLADPLRRAVHLGIARGLGYEDIAVREGVRPDTVRHVWAMLVGDYRGGSALAARRVLTRERFSPSRRRAAS